jgi:uncharacterized membrane protein (UPF0136 family)
MPFPHVALCEGIVYGALLIVGGVMGYTKAGSKPSLIMGSSSGVIAIFLSIWGLKGHELPSLFLLGGEAIVLSAFFYMRYTNSKKFMPAGMMATVSAISLIMFSIGIVVA